MLKFFRLFQYILLILFDPSHVGATVYKIFPFKAGANQFYISSNITFLPCWMKCWNGLRNYKIYKVSKKKKKIMLDDVG